MRPAIDNCVTAPRTTSKVDHADYIGNRTALGVRVIEEVASPRVKLLFDIYHTRIMEGDVIRTSRDTSPTARTSIRRAIPAGTSWTIVRS